MRRKNYVKVPRRIPAAWTRWLVIVVASAAGIALLWSLVMGEMGAVKYFRMRSRENTLRADIDRLKEDNLRLIREVHDLKYDPAYLERMARDKIGLARPGEVVYFYGDMTR
jgi:cell division protein FtsB